MFLDQRYISNSTLADSREVTSKDINGLSQEYYLIKLYLQLLELSLILAQSCETVGFLGIQLIC